MNGNDFNYSDFFDTDTMDADTAGASDMSENAEESLEGGKEQSNAGSDVMDDAEENDGAAAAGDGDTDTGKPSQSKEENSKYAAARRKAERERDEARNDAKKAKEDAERYITDSIAHLGLIDPDTGAAVVTKEQFEAYKEKLSSNAKRDLLDRTGMSDKEYQTFIDSLPEVRKAKELTAEAERKSRDAELEKAKNAVAADLKEISAVNPDIKTLDDLVGLPNYGEIYEKIKRGYSLSDAYFSVNRKEISSRQAASARQAALNAVSSKGHLESSSSRGTGGVSVPPEVIKMYREMSPGITDAEIKEHYSSYAKGKK